MRNVAYWGKGGEVEIRWLKGKYTDAPTYYREVVLTMPRTKGVVMGAEAHLNALAQLTQSGLYVVDADETDIYVDDWKVNGSFMTHKHPEFGLIRTGWTKGIPECDVLDTGKCDMCEKVVPGEIEMMHNFYRLDG